MYCFRRLPFGYVPGYAPQHFDLRDPQTLEQALFGRLYRKLPPIDVDVLEDWAKFNSQLLKELQLPFGVVPTTEHYIATLNHPTCRKDQMTAAAEENHWQFPLISTIARGDAFGKRETAVDYNRPRLIMSRCDCGKVALGPAIRAVEEVVYPLEYFTKGLTPEQMMVKVQELAQRRFQYYYESDYSSFESSEGPEKKIRGEFRWYSQVLRDVPFIKQLLDALRVGVKFTTRRREMKILLRNFRYSGEVDTSLGNGIMNLITCFYACYVEYGRDFAQSFLNFGGLFEGDDGLFGCNRPLTERTFIQLGFSIKLKAVDDPRLASFCGLTFGESGQVIRSPRKFLQKFGWTINKIHAGDKTMKMLLKAKAMSAICTTPHCPIVGVMAREALKFTKNVHALFDESEYRAFDKSNLKVAFAPTHETRLLFEQLYDVSVPDQVEIEDAIRRGDMSRVSQLLPPTAMMLHYESAYVMTQRLV